MVELLLLVLLLTFIFGWNNSSFITGNLIGSGLFKTRTSVWVAIVGLFLGMLLEGNKMVVSLDGKLATGSTTQVFLTTLIVSIIFTLILTIFSMPVSFSITIVGAFLGSAFGSSASINVTETLIVILFWFIAPILTALLTYSIYTFTARIMRNLDLLTVDLFNRIGALLGSIVVSYSLGGNNIGLIYGASGSNGSNYGMIGMALSAIVAVLGVLLFGKGNVAGTIGDRMLVLSPQAVVSVFISSALFIWIGTQLSIPISISQCLLGGMFGAAYARSIVIINRKLVLELILSWIIIPILSYVTAFLIAIL